MVTENSEDARRAELAFTTVEVIKIGSESVETLKA